MFVSDRLKWRWLALNSYAFIWGKKRKKGQASEKKKPAGKSKS